MKPEIKKKWLKALRSGEYDQTKGVLLDSNRENGDKFCCLGVLCNLYAKEHPGTGFKYDGYYDQYRFFGTGTTLPERVLKWAKISDKKVFNTNMLFNPRVDAKSYLALLNDEEDKNFNEIADWIEENL